MEFILALIIGAIVGRLGSMIFKGRGLGLIGNIVAGIIGGLIGYWLFRIFGISLGTELIGTILTGAIGAAAILLSLNLIFGGFKK